RLGAHRGTVRRADTDHSLPGRTAEPGDGRGDGLRSSGRDRDRGARGARGACPLTNTHPLLPSVRGDLLAKLGRNEEARVEFERAAALTRNLRERELLLQRAASSGTDRPLLSR